MRSETWRAEARAVRRATATIALIGGAVFLSPAVSSAQLRAPSAKSQHAPPPAAAPAAVQMDFAAMVERYGPAVVNIGTTARDDTADQASAAPGLDNLDPDDPVFALVRGMSAQPAAPSTVADPPRVVWGTGSGFIISADGIVVTTAHIVNRAEQVVVTLTDRRQFKANVLGVDPQTDVALLQIEGAGKLPSVRVGDASHVRVGERVLAIGSPDGPQNAATSGLISVTPHALADGNGFTFLETDIAPDPDTSGGPLLDRNGAVIGVNLQVYADTGRYRSLTFAIPIDAALRLRAQLQGQGKVSGGSLGLQTQDVDPGLAAAFGLPHATGALVTAAAPAGHGSLANPLKAGDVVTRINGKTIEHESDLTDYVSALPPGSKVSLTVVRNKKPTQLTAIVAARAGQESESGSKTRGPGAAERNLVERSGLTVHALSEDERRASGAIGGVVVDAATGAAEAAGIQPGDVILSVNSERIDTRNALEALLERSGKQVALLIQRDNTRSFVSMGIR